MSEQDNSKLVNQVISLAGIVQAVQLVEKLANSGYDDSEQFATMVHALLETEPGSTEAVFIDRHHLKPGLETLVKLLNQEQDASGDVMRYCLGIVHLERKLNARKDMLALIGSRLAQAKNQATHFSPTHSNVIANIASIYLDTISTFAFRIQVNGNSTHLQQETTVNKIRCLLLAAIRCAVLWRQNGGGRIKMILQRRKYADTAQALLNDLP